MRKMSIGYNSTSFLIIVYQMILYIAMISGYKGIAYYISFGTVILIFRKMVKKNGSISTNKSWNNIMFFLFYYTLTSLINLDVGNYVIYLIYYIIIFFPMLMAEYLKSRTSTVMIKKSLICFTVVFIGFCLISIGYYLLNPGFAREMAANAAENRVAIGGGYQLAYASAILCVYISSKMINKKIKRKLIYILLCVVCFCLVYLTESSITFLAMLVGIIISLITKKKEGENKYTENDVLKWMIMGIVIITLVVVIVYYKHIIAEAILDFTEGNKSNIVYSRIEEIINKFVYGKTNYHVDKRSDTLTQSIDIFKKYPIFGMGYRYGYVFSVGEALGMGNHSEILDSLAKYGIVGGYLWLMPYFRTLKQIIHKNFGCVVTILIMMYFNPFASFHSNAVMFLFIPLYEEMLKRIEK